MTESGKGEGHHPEIAIKAMATFCSSHSSIQTSSLFTPIHQIQHLIMEPVPMKSVNNHIKTKHSFEKMADNRSPNQKGKGKNLIESVGNYSHDFDTKSGENMESQDTLSLEIVADSKKKITKRIVTY